MYCTVLYCTVLYCTALHCTALHCTALHCTALHCTALHCTPLHSTPLHYTTLHYTTLHYTTLHYTTLHYTTLHYTIRILLSATHTQGDLYDVSTHCDLSTLYACSDKSAISICVHNCDVSMLFLEVVLWFLPRRGGWLQACFVVLVAVVKVCVVVLAFYLKHNFVILFTSAK